MPDRARWGLWRILTLIAIAGLIVLLWSQRGRFAPLEVGSMAPAYSAPALQGGERSLADYRGKVVVLNVWATWCQPCVKEMPALQRLYEQFRSDGLEVVAVSVDAGIGATDEFGRAGGDVGEFVREFELGFTILLDPKRRIEQQFGLSGVPTTIIIDRAGRIARKAIGIEVWDDEAHQAEMRELLAKKP
jgi:cytochrome c biogenesis protein CcmG/thiol:disulfide interchange protein DsbE